MVVWSIFKTLEAILHGQVSSPSDSLGSIASGCYWLKTVIVTQINCMLLNLFFFSIDPDFNCL